MEQFELFWNAADGTKVDGIEVVGRSNWPSHMPRIVFVKIGGEDKVIEEPRHVRATADSTTEEEGK